LSDRSRRSLGIEFSERGFELIELLPLEQELLLARLSRSFALVEQRLEVPFALQLSGPKHAEVAAEAQTRNHDEPGGAEPAEHAIPSAALAFSDLR
jgi:hypothetical protein